MIRTTEDIREDLSLALTRLERCVKKSGEVAIRSMCYALRGMVADSPIEAGPGQEIIDAITHIEARVCEGLEEWQRPYITALVAAVERMLELAEADL